MADPLVPDEAYYLAWVKCHRRDTSILLVALVLNLTNASPELWLFQPVTWVFGCLPMRVAAWAS